VHQTRVTGNAQATEAVGRMPEASIMGAATGLEVITAPSRKAGGKALSKCNGDKKDFLPRYGHLCANLVN